MAGASAAKTSRRQAKELRQEVLYDRELEDLPRELRWREWMLRVELVTFCLGRAGFTRDAGASGRQGLQH
jgi:hypothetical protein